MAPEKRRVRHTATIDPDLLEAIKAEVGERGVSEFLNEAARDRLQRMSITRLLDEMDEECGPVPDEIMEEVRRDMESIFYGDGDPPEGRPRPRRTQRARRS